MVHGLRDSELNNIPYVRHMTCCTVIDLSKSDVSVGGRVVTIRAETNHAWCEAMSHFLGSVLYV